MYRIFYADYLPSLNKGELAILQGMMESFQYLGDVKFTTLSFNPELDVPRYGHTVKTLSISDVLHLKSGTGKILTSIWVVSQYLFFICLYKIIGLRILSILKAEIWQEYVKANVILVGHGGVFSLKGSPWFPVYCYPLLNIFTAKNLDKPIILYGGSTGLPERLPYFLRKMAKFILNRLDLITVRQSSTYQNIINTGIRRDKVFLTADPAFLLQPVSTERVKEIMNLEGIDGISGPIIGITVARHIAVKTFSNEGSSELCCSKHNEIMAQVIDSLIDKYNAMVVFIPHCIGLRREHDERDDRIIAKDIFQLCKNKENVKVMTNEYGAEELKGLIGQFTFFIGERIHSVVNAMSMYVPSIALSHLVDQRLDIIRMLGQKESIYYVDNIDCDTLLAKIEDTWIKRDAIREDLKGQVDIIKERVLLNSKLLKQLLDSRKMKAP